MLFTLLSATLVGDAKTFDPPGGAARELRTRLAKSLVAADNANLSHQERLALLRSAAVQAVERLQPHSPVRERLTELAQPPAELLVDEQLMRARQAIRSALDDLTFRPIAEAELPAGFPNYTPVGTIEIKKYPSYRMAAGPGFWTLFTHIQLNQIKMTAPVEMTYTRDEDGGWRQSGMAFLYGRKEFGSVGPKGKVTVLDNEPQLVISLGLKGQRTPRTIADAQRRLQCWIEDSQTYRVSGNVRAMGYNSPYVPADKQYFEVQVPVEVISATVAKPDAR